MKMILLVLVVFCFVVVGCEEKSSQKINGISLVATPEAVIQEHINSITNVHANFAAVMPFGFIRSLNDPEIVFNTDRQWFGETAPGAKQAIEMLHKNHIEVLLKPQLWIWRGEFTGHLSMEDEAAWKVLEESYRDFIMTFAYLAEEQKVSVFCIGTELEQFVANRPLFWKDLIREIRSIYHGKLTYAANWDEYKRLDLWDDLDFIGVDAYFPISDEKTPTAEAAQKNWDSWKLEMQGVSEKFEKPILFTEFGYRSVDYAGKEPWRSDREMEGVNFEAQSNLLEALFEAVWTEPWFAGGFLWKWHPNEGAGRHRDDTQFSPQNKPALEKVEHYYALQN
ncbi:MAG: glycoside hydrolase [Flavobacteriaceae bacterium]